MSDIQDRIKKKREELEGGGKASSSSSSGTSNTSSSEMSIADRIRAKKSQIEYESLISSLSRQYDTASNLSDEYARRNKQYGSGYKENSWEFEREARMAKYRYDVQKQALNRLLKENGVSEEDAYKIRQSISDAGVAINAIHDIADAEEDFYSQFKGKNDYDSAMDALKDRLEKMNYDVDGGQREIDELRKIYNEASKYVSADNTMGKYATYYNTIDGMSRSQADRLTAMAQEENAENIKKYLQPYGYSSLAELEADISDKTRYLNQAKSLQAIEATKNESDFAQFSTVGRTINNPSYEDADVTSGNIGNIVTFSKDNYAKIMEGKENPTVLDRGKGESKYNFMTDDEVDVYNYYLGKESVGLVAPGTAQEFLDGLSDTLNMREAAGGMQFFEDKTGLEILFGITSGMNQYVGGMGNTFKMIGDAFNDEDRLSIETPSVAYLGSMVREDLADDGPKVFGSSLGQIAYDTITTNTNMLASQATAWILGGALGAGESFVNVAGTAFMGAAATGNVYAEMINSGANESQARAMSIVKGVWESVSEYYLGAIEEYGGNVINKKLWGAAAHGMARGVLEFVADGLQEGLEEVIQSIGETIIEGLMTGKFEFASSEEMWYDFVLGALSAWTMNGMTGFNKYLANRLNTARMGEEVRANGGFDSLMAQANKYGEYNSELKALADKVAGVDTENMGKIKEAVYNKNVGELFAKTNEAARDRFTTLAQGTDGVKIRRVLESKGVKNASEATRILVKSMYEDLTPVERSVFKKVNGKDVLNQALNTRMSEREYYHEADTIVNDINRLNESISGNRVSDDGLTKTTDGKTISIKEIATLSKNGENVDATVRTEDGETVKLSDVVYGTESEAVLFENAVKLADNAASANAIINAYDPRGTLTADSYIEGAMEAYRYGKINYTLSSIKNDTFFKDLTVAQKKLIYGLGQVDGKTSSGKRHSNLAQSISNKGNVTILDSAANRKTWNDKQATGMKMIARVVSSFTHGNVYVYASQVVDGKRVITDNFANKDRLFDPEKTAPHGAYDTETGDIYLDLNAGNDGEGYIVWTFAHELVHDLRANLPDKFKALADFLMDAYGKNGVDVQALIRTKRERSNYKLDFDSAYEEVVADSLMTMFTDTDVVERMAELKTKDKTLWQKIKDFFNRMYQALVKAYEGSDPYTDEGKFFRTMLDSESINTLRDMFAEGLVELGEAREQAIDSMPNNEAFTDSSVAVLNQIRPPYTDGTKACNEFIDSLSDEARETYEMFHDFYELSRVKNTTNINGRPVKNLNISSVFLTAQQWNDKISADAKWKDVAIQLAESLPEKVRKSMNFNLDGTITPTMLEKEFKMAKSLAQRLVDSLGYETIDREYELGGKKIILDTVGATQSVGGESYRRALIAETRRLYEEGKLKKVGIGTLKKDRWGSLGFLAQNGKTTASGDLTTLCPQMMYNKGCYYCYRRAAMESGVNNKLVAEKVWYTGEILRIKDSDVAKLNENGGLRIQSFGDWQPHFSAQLADILYDAELRGLQVKIITKEPSMIEYVAKLKEQGLGKSVYFNLSADYAIERGPEKFSNAGDNGFEQINPSRPYGRDAGGQVWWKRAMTVEEAYAYRQKYPWVNVRIVATDLNEFIRGLKDPKVQVVTGYHGNIREWERVDSATGEFKVNVEPLGDNGMPTFAFVDGRWVKEDPGKTKTHKALAQAIEENNLQLDYYNKTCCITGHCASCKGKCGKIADSFYTKNANNLDDDSKAYWVEHLNRKQLFEYKEQGKYSDRAYFNNDDFKELRKDNLLVDALYQTIYSAAPSWNSRKLEALYKEHPELDYIERLQQKDKSAKTELQDLVNRINDAKLLDDFRWFIGEGHSDTYTKIHTAYGDLYDKISYKKTHAKGIKDFRAIIDARMVDLKDNGGHSWGWTNNQEFTVAEIRDLYNKYNTYADAAPLAEKVFSIAEKLNIAIKASNAQSKNARTGDQTLRGFYLGNRSLETGRSGLVSYTTDIFNGKEYSDTRKAQTLLHELIHACTSYAYYADQMNIDLSNWSIFESLDNIYRKIAYGRETALSDIRKQYGLTDKLEFLAEMSNPEFREKLSKLKVNDLDLYLQTLGVMGREIGLDPNKSYDQNVLAVLDAILDNFDMRLYDKMSDRRIYQNTKVKYSGRDYSSTVKNSERYGIKLSEDVESLLAKADDYKSVINEATTIHRMALEQLSAFNQKAHESADVVNAKVYEGGAKSLNSLIGKILRKRLDEPGSQYAFLDAKDHVRCAIAVNSISDIPELISEIKKNFPSLKGEAHYLTEWNSWGYRGMHITTTLSGGLHGEIQITTPKAWKLKLESDAIYDKWRNYTTEPGQEYSAEYISDIKKSSDLWQRFFEELDYESVREAEELINSLATVSETTVESKIIPSLPEKGTHPEDVNSRYTSLESKSSRNKRVLPSDNKYFIDDTSYTNYDTKKPKLEDINENDFEEGTRFSERILMGSYFSGGGTLESGLVYKMLDSEFAVEYDGQIAAVWMDNHGKEQMYVGDVREFDPRGKRNIFYFHASPSCQNTSMANHKRRTKDDVDFTTAQATATALREKRPPVFTCENVKQYIGTPAYNIITDALNELGYNWDVGVYKASDYGNATKRERMVIRAVAQGMELPPKPEKVGKKTSWGEATRDLWETELKPFHLNESTISALRNTPALKNLNLTEATKDRALLIYGTNNSHRVDYAWEDELAPTLTTKCGDARIVLNGRVYQPTPKFMGRLQGLDDNYKYPTAKTRAFKIIGNGIPTQLTKAVMGGVLGSAYEQTNGEALYSQRDSEYLELAKSPDVNKYELQKAVANEALKKMPDVAKDSSGKPLHLYHGTPNFGFTEFMDEAHDYPLIYTSTASSVAAHYAGDNNYAFAREIGKGYTGGTGIQDIISDAKTVYGNDYRVASEQEKESVFKENFDKAVEIADKIDELSLAADLNVNWDTEEGERFGNALASMSDLFFHLRDGDVTSFADAIADEYGWADWFNHLAEAYEENSRIVREYYDEHRNELDDASRKYLSYLLGFDVGDAAIDISYGIRKMLATDDLLIDEKGNLAVPDQLWERMSESHNIGAYDMYGNLGDNPYVIDCNGAQFWAIKNPDMGDGYYGTDSIARWAHDNGYTSVIMKNIYDYGDKADNYVFFDSSQLKSADPVTYDNNGDVIPLSERFDDSTGDIRYSSGDVSDADYDEQINYLNNRDLSMEDYDADETVALDLSHGEMQRLMELAPEIKGNFHNGFNSMLDITRVLDKVSDGNAEVREFFKKSLELPMRDAKDSYVKGMRSQWDAIADLVEKTGIKAGTQESAAAQWYGEGYKQLEDGTRVDYTLDDLKKDFPSKWQDIVKVEQFARQAYDNYVDRINEVLEKIYPDIEKQQKDKIIKAKVKLQDAIKMFTEARLGANQDMVDYYDLKVDQAWAELEYEQNRYTSGDYLLNKRLQKRSDYFRHFTEMKSSTIGSIVNLLKSQGTLIDPALVGTSEFSKPKTKWQSFMQRQGKGSFTADAIGGLAEYVPNAEYSIAFNPVIAHYRTFEKALRDATRATSSANNLIGYLGDYTNELAGKTNSWDRLLIKSMSETEGRKTLNVIAKLNSRMTANAVVGNVATALKQFSNIPNGLSLVKSNSAWARGMVDYFAGILGDKVDRGAYAKDLLSKSVFMNERYSEFSADDFKNFKGFEKVGKGVSDFFGWMLGFGDEQAARMIWYAAYNEAVEKGSQDPVYDADVITRKAVGGRGVGEIPVFWKNKSINLIMPFQIEVNNSWQNLKQMVGNNDAKGLLRLAVGSYITNLVAKQLVGGAILPDILGVLIETLKKAVKKVKDDDDETTWGDIVTYALRNTLGQVVAMAPGVNWGGTALVGVDSDLGEKLFGDSNPFSYGTGMMGTKSLAQTAGDILENGFSGADLVSPLLQYGLPMGGRQASRMYSAAQDLGWLPSGGWGNTPFGGERHQIPGKYTNSAEPSLKFSLDTDNLSEVAKALLLGTYATDSAQEYLETRKNEASNSLLQKGIYIQDEYGVDARDFFEWYKIANENGGSLSQKDVTSASGLTNDQKWYLWEAMMNTGGDNAWKKQNPYSRPKK